MQVQQHNIDKNPEVLENIARQEIQTQRYSKQKKTLRTEAAIVTIPVVVHVIYNTSIQNITDEVILSQIAILNKDYSATNTDISKVPAEFQSMIGNPNIQFGLAKRDPNGKATTGIVRVPTSKTGFSYSLDDAKYSSQGGDDAWPSGKYLNIWVVPQILDGSSTVLGYATLPGTSSAAEDGVVIGYKYFGINTLTSSFNLGRTATHEIGHWLNLYHTFEGGCKGTTSTTCQTAGDKVCDTPPTSTSNYQCPGTQNTCTESPTDHNDMTMNFLDYVNDACMFMFSAGQATRMQAAINGPRQSLLTSNGLTPTYNLDASIDNISGISDELCVSSIYPSFTFRNEGLTTITSITYTYKIDNGAVTTQSWSGNLASAATATIELPFKSGLSEGSHTYTVNITLVNNQIDDDQTYNQLTKSFTILPVLSLPYTESFENNGQLPSGWSVTNPDNDYTWEVTDLAASDGIYSATVNNFEYEGGNGQIDNLSSPYIAISSGASLQFDVAYKLYTPATENPNFSDTLTILATADCGNTTQVIYKSSGQDLTTGTPYHTINRFVPASEEWETKSIDLTAYEGKNVRFIFRNTSDHENMLYIDNIRINGTSVTVGDQTISSDVINLSPNPTKGSFVVNATKNIDFILIYDILGRQIQYILSSGTNSQTIDLSSEERGIYLVKTSAGGVTKVSKIIVE